MTKNSPNFEIERADALRDNGSIEAAIDIYQQIVESNPEYAKGHYKLGTAYARLNRLIDAEACYRKALSLNKNYPEAANNLGILLTQRSEFDEAENLYRIALANTIDYFEAHINLGNLLRNTSRPYEALYHYHRAIQLEPSSATPRSHIGSLLRELGQPGEALGMLQSATHLDPTNAATWSNLGICHISRGDLSSADLAFQEANKCDPKETSAWINRMLISNWQSIDRKSAYDLHITCCEHLVPQSNETVFLEHKNPIQSDRRLRIGFVSGDFRRHSVSYFIEGSLAQLDPNQIESWAYFNYAQEDYRTAQLKPLFIEWRNIFDLTDIEAATIIMRDQIDILIDLAGHTGHTRLGVFALKPAPIQVSWIGYPNTTGLKTIDYRFTDIYADPPGTSEEFHSESLFHLPNCFLCYSPPKDAPEVAQRSNNRDEINFGSFNTRVKIGNETLALWHKVLTAVPNARLIIKSAAALEEQTSKNELIEKMRLAGIDTERVTLHSSKESLIDHLALYSCIDICLDTFPYNGTTTTCEALWMGVPVVTLAGDRHAARVGVSLLTNVGLQELIANDAEEYARIATDLANDLDRLAALRTTMRERLLASHLLNSNQMAQSLEKAFRQMWVKYCKSNSTHSDTNKSPVGEPYIVKLRRNYQISVDSPMISLTGWVVLEQEDWFEDEIGFICDICKRTWNAIDIGASHGIYSLLLAERGASQTWAFEPSSKPRLQLRDSIRLNDFDNRISVIPSGLSDRTETLEIALPEHSESTSIRAVINGKSMETISLSTLDSLQGNKIPKDIRFDFVKMDAEGEEVAILRGGLRFFCEQSPLVMFEYKHDKSINTELLNTFRAMNYEIFQLLPELGCLAIVPRQTEMNLDTFTLNLFACKADKAEELANASRLVGSEININLPLYQEWSKTLLNLPALSALCPANWETFDFNTNYGKALLAWCGSRQIEELPSARLNYLNQAFHHFQSCIEHEDTHPAVPILGVRICSDLGRREIAINIAGAFLDQMEPDEEIPLDRPLPPAYSTFDNRQPKTSLSNFLYESVVEFLFNRRLHSQCFGNTPSWLLERALSNPEHTARIERSAVLCHIRDDKPLKLEPNAPIFQHSPDNLNPEIWLALARQHGMLINNDIS